MGKSPGETLQVTGVFNASSSSGLLPGDILYYYHSEQENHIGIYLGGGYTVEARGQGGSQVNDETGNEIAVYNWAVQPVTFDKVFRIPEEKLHRI